MIIYCILCGTGTSFVYQEYLAAFIFKTWEIAAKKIEMTLGIHKLVAYQSQILNQWCLVKVWLFCSQLCSFLMLGKAQISCQGQMSRKYYRKAHLPGTKLLCADLLRTCCNVLDNSVAAVCLSFPIGCMAIKTHNYLCKPTCAALTCILTKPVETQVCQRTRKRCCCCTLAAWPVDIWPNLPATDTHTICPDQLEDINTQYFLLITIIRIGQKLLVLRIFL